MAGPSSTSSSEADPLAVVRAAAGRKAFPRALVLAIAIVLLFEILLRNSGWPKTLPYETGRMEYWVAAQQIERAGAAEVSIVGSSRARESIVVPLMHERLSAALGRPVSVANYALSGAYTSDFEAVVKRLLRATPRPRIIMVGISERDLVNAGWIWDEVPRFYNVDDLIDAYRERGAKALADVPTVLRAAIGRRWRTLGLREFIALKIARLCTGDTRHEIPSPAEGGYTEWQRLSPKRNMVNRPIKSGGVLERSAAFDPAQFPDRQLSDSLQDLMTACDEAQVVLIFYEVHTSRELREALPAGFYSLFTDYITNLTKAHDDVYIRLRTDLKLKLANADMREPSHMSMRGATRLTEALVDRVLVKILKPSVETKLKQKRQAKRAATQTATQSSE